MTLPDILTINTNPNLAPHTWLPIKANDFAPITGAEIPPQDFIDHLSKGEVAVLDASTNALDWLILPVGD